MQRDHHRWFSHQLGRDMELLTFGHAGQPMVVFPTSMGAFFEYEDQGMVAGARRQDRARRAAARLRRDDGPRDVLRPGVHPRQRIDRYLAWERYLVEDVVPFVARSPAARPLGVTGCSFGAYHAMTMALRHPDVFRACVTMGGAFDVRRFLDGYHDLDAYLLSPPHFLPGLGDPWFLERIAHNKWVLVTGEHDICRADTEHLAAMFASRGMPHSLHIWGFGSEHDWPEWRRMARAYLP